MAKTPMMKQYDKFKDQYPDKIVLFRMGDFYETFGEDAKQAAKILNITLTSRDKKSDPTPLAGFPHHALDQYLPKIIDAGESAVIVEQLEDPKQAKGVVKRGVVRVVTPGTLDGDHANQHKNSYLVAIFSNKDRAAIAHIDISTGEFKVTEIPNINSKINELVNSISPQEILVLEGNSQQLESTAPIQIIEKYIGKKEESEKIIKEFYNIKNVNSLGLEDSSEEVTITIAMVLSYIQDTQKMNPEHIGHPEYYKTDGRMFLDSATIRNLDLVANSYTGQINNSLFEVLDDTKTRMGKRLLYSWILSPLTDLKQIKLRLDTVERLVNNTSLNKDLQEILSEISDIERIVGKIGLNRVDGKDFKALQFSIENAFKLYEKIKNEKEITKFINFSELFTGENSLETFSTAIENTIADAPPNTILEGGVIQNGFNNEVDELRNISGNSKNWINEFTAQEKKKTGIPSLKIGFNKVFGYYIEVTKVHQDKVPESYIRKQTLVNSERYITEELKEKEAIILGAEEKLSKLEYQLFQDFRDSSLKYIPNLKKLGLEIAKLDVITGFSSIARMNAYTKAVLHETGAKNRKLVIRKGKHPVVERISEEDFISNDTDLFGDNLRMAIITGPNMSGKSTYIRQVALLVLMAQIGSFVPAESMELSVVDRIFSRVGAADDLSKGRSTFMVEMEETANILNNATEDSLIILDEVGRGTSTYDGVSIAWALSEYLIDKLKSRVLFATHYHELVQLQNEFPDNIKNYNVYVKEDKERDEVVFMRKIVVGNADKSYGVYVAKLAGLPTNVVSRANDILSSFETNGDSQPILKEQESSPKNGDSANKQNKDKALAKVVDKAEKVGQITFFSGTDNKETDPQIKEIIKQLNKVDLNNLTPIDALKVLEELKNKASK